MSDGSCLASWFVGRRRGTATVVVQSPARHPLPAPVCVMMNRAVIVDDYL